LDILAIQAVNLVPGGTRGGEEEKIRKRGEELGRRLGESDTRRERERERRRRLVVVVSAEPWRI
jgi:hypothetical protein